MSTTAVGHCLHCAAVVNIHWPSCLVCHALITAPSCEEAIPEAAAPMPPLKPGWRVVYMDHQWKLAGGHDDPDHGTVQECRWTAGGWTVHLTDGQVMPLSRIRSVAALDDKGRPMGVWTVRECGYDGEGPL